MSAASVTGPSNAPEAGLVSVHFVNVVSDPSVAPFGGVAARVGTNPFSVGIPRDGKRPVILDFATSKLAVGKVRVAMNQGKPLPAGALLTAAGEPTTDPSILFGQPKGILLPFGDHKGWGLSFACELLGAALTGGKTQSGPKRRNATINCMLSILISPERLGTADTLSPEIDTFVGWVRSGDNAGVLLPGDVEATTTAERHANGIPIDAKSWSDIVAAAREVGAEPPSSILEPAIQSKALVGAMKITDVTVTQFEQRGIRALTFGPHNAPTTGTSTLGLVTISTDDGTGRPRLPRFDHQIVGTRCPLAGADAEADSRGPRSARS